MTKNEAFVIVRRIFFADGSEKKISELVNIISDAFPNARMIDLIFHDDRELTPDQIVDEAFEREAAYARQAKQG